MAENETKAKPWWLLPATPKQRAILKAEGYDPNVNRRIAQEIIANLIRQRRRRRGGV
jgi:hypothetical protein